MIVSIEICTSENKERESVHLADALDEGADVEPVAGTFGMKG